MGAASVDAEWLDDVAITKIETTAGGSGRVRDERITNRIKFRTLRLDREGLNPRECRIIRIAREPM